jgi:phytoene dehydrogenase-like protein
MPDAIVVGAGPNGLTAAIALAQAGRSVLVLEAAETVGGGTRTAELTLPGFRHDVCSAIHPLGLGSPYLRTLPLDEHGLEWIQPPTPLAHPFDDGTAALLERSIEGTGATLGPDAGAYRKLMGPLVAKADELLTELLGPLRVPHHPLLLARFGVSGARSAEGVAKRFRGERAGGFFAGLAAHSMLPLSKPPSAAFGLMLGLLGHHLGWPLPRGGSQASP